MSPRQAGRRRFLRFSSALSATALLAACGQRGESRAPSPTPAASRTSDPTATATSTATPAPSPTVSLVEKAGQMVLAGFRGLSVNAESPIVRDLRESHVGGVILFSYDVPLGSPVRNVESPAQLRTLVEQLHGFAPGPLIVAVDQEGGRVARLNEDYGFPATLSARELASLGDLEQTRAHAGRMAETLATAGINVNLAPVVDLHDPDNPVIGALERSFSAEPLVVIERARAFIQGHHDHGVRCALKHFPGHGSSKADSHLGFVDVTATWTNADLQPFAALVEGGFADSVMTAHIFNGTIDPVLPATLSRATVQDLLRQSLGFEGVVFSDDLQMGAIREHYGFDEAIELAVQAGVDIMIFGNNLVYDEGAPGRAVATIVRLVEDGRISTARLDESYGRITRFKEGLLLAQP
ncbi:MAG TPA: beta-N-acetylhexosaminidase [Tepidiformaceae bacterium]